MYVLAIKTVHCFGLLHFYKILDVLTGLINMVSILFREDSW